ncbi:TPA: hypothetical protein QDZ12_003382 [Pseudomonas putida]|nr:hypothetical protein [Pseudomonas putida]
MSALDKILNFFWPDNRSEWERKQEQLFIDAVNKLKNYYVTDRGGLSMDPEEAREALLRFAQQNKKAPQVGHRVEAVQAEILMERYAWRRLDNASAVRYEFLVCDNGLWTVVSAQLFSSTATPVDGLQSGRSALGNTVKAVISDDLVWHSSIDLAIQAYESELKGVS